MFVADEVADTETIADTDTDLQDSDVQVASACDAPVGEGWGEGQISHNWTLKDRGGSDVSLYDYCGRVIYIEATAAW